MIRAWIICGAAFSALLVAGAQPQVPQFVEVARHAGIDFHHVNGASPDKHIAETMGSGGLFFDYDGDGWLDIFLVDGGSLADAPARRARHRLYRNRGNGTFEDVTEGAGIRHRAYGMGACAADYDGDGHTDLYVTNFGANILYRNDGGRRFTDVTAAARVGSPLWSASCAFGDLDMDGDLDLFVANYVDADPTRSPFCGNASTGARFYCHPLSFKPLPNTVYLNDGRGVFTDVSAQSGIAAHRGNGLGVVIADYNEDGGADVFVANDSVPNFLFRNERNGRFAEVALEAGVAVASDGRPRAGMGIDTADYDGDGRMDAVITNLDLEMHTLHRGLARGLFANATAESGIGFATLPFVGFGAVFFDADHDAQLDLAIANGNLDDNASQVRSGATYAQRNLLFRNTTRRRFTEVGRAAGPGFAIEKVSRGLAAGDIDNDGDLDLLVTNNGQSADLLRNEGGMRRNAMVIRLAGRRPNPDAIGARVRVTTGSLTQTRDVKAGSSYLSQNDTRVHLGIGAATIADRLEIRWPSGRVETLHKVPGNRIVTIREGEGISSATPFIRPRQ